MLPFAPPRFSITTVWPSRVATRGSTTRAAVSTPPPAG